MVELLNSIARLWWDWTAAMFWQVGLLIILIGCIDLLIRKWAWPQLRYALWSLILIKLLLPPTLSLPSGIVPGLQSRVAHVLRWMDAGKPIAGESSAGISDLGLRIWLATLVRNSKHPVRKRQAPKFRRSDLRLLIRRAALICHRQSPIRN